MNTMKTRNESGKVIDHFICNFNRTCKLLHSTIAMDNKFTDHNMIITSMDIFSQPKKNEFKTFKRTNYRKMVEHFEKYVATTNLLAISDPNEIADQLTSLIRESINESTVHHSVKLKRSYALPWITHSIASTLVYKNKLACKLRRKRNDSILKQKYMQLSTQLRRQIKHEKDKYKKNKLSSNDQKVLWSSINDLLGRKKDSKIKMIKADGRTVIDEIEMVNIFSENFKTKIDKMVENISESSPISNLNHKPSSSRNSIFLIPPNVEEIKRTINSLSTSASGMDGISSTHIKILIEPLSILLVHLIERIYASGIYPNCFKTALVTPICKTNDTSNVKDYRPISVLSTLNKIIEKTIHKRLNDFFNKINYLSSNQYGFRSKSGTECAAVDLVNVIQKELDEGKKVSMVLLDLSSAFDIVNRKLLINVLENAGIRGVAATLMESYLSNRYQICKIDNVLSQKQSVKHGVIQGSVLGPLLFNIFINGISKLDVSGRIFLYADDIALINVHAVTQPVENVVKSDLECITKFIESRRLILNTSKTQFMILHSPYKKINLEDKIKLHDGTFIHRVEHVKYLGLHLDQNLKFEHHISQLITKSSRAAGILWKLKKYPLVTKKNIYRTFIESHLFYMATVWGTASNIAIKPLQIVQNRSLRFVYQLDKYTNRVEMYMNHVENALPIRAINYFCAASFIHNCIHHNMHTNTIFEKAPANTRCLRRSNVLRPSSARINYGKKRITFFGVKFYNQIPNEIQKINDTYRFKRKLKKHIKNEGFITECFSQ